MAQAIYDNLIFQNTETSETEPGQRLFLPVGSLLETPFFLGKHKSCHGLMVGSANDITEVCHLCCHPWREPVVVQATTRPLILQKDAKRIFKKYIYLEPKCPLFDWKRPSFGGKAKDKWVPGRYRK